MPFITNFDRETGRFDRIDGAKIYAESIKSLPDGRKRYFYGSFDLFYGIAPRLAQTLGVCSFVLGDGENPQEASTATEDMRFWVTIGTELNGHVKYMETLNQCREADINLYGLTKYDGRLLFARIHPFKHWDEGCVREAKAVMGNL